MVQQASTIFHLQPTKQPICTPLHKWVAPEKPTGQLLTIKQGERESLRQYVKWFNKEVLEVDKVEDKVQLTSFKSGLKSKEFVMALAKSPTTSMIELLIKAQKHMNAEDALIMIEVGEPQTTKEGAQDDPKGQKRERKDHSSSHDRNK